jgi:hypothetical protein
VVASAAKTAAICPAAGAVLSESGGSLVLFEAVTDEGNCSWSVACRREGTPALTMLGREQLVNKYDESWASPQLAEVIAAGAGVVRFEGSGLKLALFICGQNNVPQADAGTALLKGTPPSFWSSGALASVFNGEWIMLNPARRPVP